MRLFPMQATVELMTGSTGQVEPILEAGLEIRCLVEAGEQVVQTASGRTEVSTATAYCHPDTPDVPPGSRFTFQGRSWVVIQSKPWRFPGRPVESVELALR
jgi:hypothetical protein